ncbi:helix-turn-helix domain-containing protein [Magnetospirillum fulvum]|uniref:helix-turn-helix domain-containing protein n=1 Tax=Magnetospirillum fulvum TaxID=1082 RepID=UPI0003FB1B97|nr:helix-turn-helix domain-containing protein [Magnetospirillum fulvum]
MARVATIIGETADVWGDIWDVREHRPTDHGFDLSLGWPQGMPRGRGGAGSPRAIVTPDVAAYLESLRHTPAQIRLPCGRGAIMRMRRLLGHDWRADQWLWWSDRIEDLATMTTDEFAREHSVSVGAISTNRQALLGRRCREAGWWRDESVTAILMSDAPISSIADDLGIAAGSVRRLRHVARTRMTEDRCGNLSSSEIKHLLDEGLTLRQIAQRAGRSFGTVGWFIRARNLRRDLISPEHAPSGPSGRMVGTITIEQARDMRANGATYKEIGDVAGVSWQSCYTSLRGSDSSVRKVVRNARAILQSDDVKAMVERGDSFVDISHATGISLGTIYRHIAAYKPQHRRPPQPSSPRKRIDAVKCGDLTWDEVVAILNQGGSVSTISKETGVSISALRNALYKRGLKQRRVKNQKKPPTP